MDLKKFLADVVAKRDGKPLPSAPPRQVDLSKIASRQQKSPPPKTDKERTKMNPLMSLIQKTKEEGNPDAWVDVKRIAKVPIVHPLTDEEYEAVNRRWVLAGAVLAGKPFKLKPQQAQAIAAYEKYDGGFCKIGVGQGKTITSLMVGQHASDTGIKKTLLCVPPEVYPQLMRRDVPQARKLIRFTVPVYGLGDTTPQRRRAISRSGKPGIYVYPYSVMSGRTAHEELEAINAQLVICDEAQNVANPRSARGKRFNRYCEARRPRVVVLSGTITKKSVKEYSHLARFCLRDNTFLPMSHPIVCEWALILDSTGYVDQDAHTGPLRPLIDWAAANFPEEPVRLDISGFRKAFRLRMDHTPGVVHADDSEDDIGTSLLIHNEPVPDHTESEGWDELKDHMDQVTEQWLTPSGDEIEHAIHTHKWLFELNAGFYNLLEWPDAEKLARVRKLSAQDADRLLLDAKLCHAAKQQYARVLRTWLSEYHIPGLDTPFLVGGDMRKHGADNVGYDLYEAWQEWQDLKSDELPKRDKHPIRVCDFKIAHAYKWAAEQQDGGILWYYHQEIGRWLVEYMKERGLDPLYCPAGRKHNERILDSHGRIVVASMKAHGVGKNLQFHGDQYWVQWKRGADVAEQGIGRTHRIGQTRDQITVWTNLTTGWDHDNFASCMNDSLYIHQTMNRQKLMYAQYDPQPMVVPMEVLKQRGFQPKEINEDMQRYLQDKFVA